MRSHLSHWHTTQRTFHPYFSLHVLPFSPPTSFHTDSIAAHTDKLKASKTQQKGHFGFGLSHALCRTVIGRVEATQEADGRDPAVHVLLRLGHQVPGPLLGSQVEDKAALQLLLSEGEAGVDLEERKSGK